MMERPIGYNLLKKEELIYEVEIRYAKPETTVTALKTQIKDLAQRLPADEILESPLDSDTDLNAVDSSMEELRTFFSTQKITFKKFNRIRALSHHLFHRLSRIEPTLDTMIKMQSRLDDELNKILGKVDALFASYHESFDKANSPAGEVPKLESRPLEKQLKSISLLQHKYGGITCVRTYLQRLDELCITRRISEAALFQGAVELFVDHALIWYRGVSGTFENWSELKKGLLNEFLSVDFDRRLLVEIRNRTQGPTESAPHFISVMLNYFSRLMVPLPEAEKLYIIQYNLRPSIVMELALEDISSIEVLKLKCRLLEHSRARVADFREPPKVNEHTLAPDLACPTPSKSTSKVEQIQSRPMFCVRCRVDGHLLNNCTSKEVVCFTCGNKGFTSGTCLKCNKKEESAAVSKN